MDNKITDAVQFNALLRRTKPDEKNNSILNLKIRIRGKKVYGEWKFKDVFQVLLKQNHKSLDTVPKFNPNELPAICHPISDQELDLVYKNL
ncbi:hypothetical protein F8M41_011409 [Gigaspora margarita]|uniref:Uncharacterized protein n=1 Tax=Gigaspora margarita TaxID=4874 RepID=A0A8H3X112_GIGMA|nr:hypothetical protein F8M41_011409 [Gigaspora margarita]